MTDVHFLTASLSLFQRETESERERESSREKTGEAGEEEGGGRALKLSAYRHLMLS